MAKRWPVRRVVTGGAAAIAVSSAACFCTSLFWGIWMSAPYGRYLVALTPGKVEFGWNSPNLDNYLRQKNFEPRGSFQCQRVYPALVVEQWLWRPRIVEGLSKNGRQLKVPLWLPVLVASIATGLMLLLNRPRRLSTGCPKCGYDLTGNASRTCPECATPVPAPAKP